MLDEIDKQLLNIMQHDFPLVSRPYARLGEIVGISESEVLSHVKTLYDADVIRKIGASFNTTQLGHASALVAAKAPPERLDEIAEVVNSYPEVTHNYGRDSEYNLWFTVIAPGSQEIESVVAEIKLRTGLSDIYILPALRLFKINVKFDL